MAAPGRKKSLASGGHQQKVPVVRGKSSARFRAPKRNSPAVDAAEHDSSEELEDSDDQEVRATTGPKSGAQKRPRGRQRKGRGPSDHEAPAMDYAPVSAFRRGAPIAMKFAVPTAATVAFFMGLLGYLTYNITYREVDQQINERGKTLAAAIAASVDRVFWEVPADLLEDWGVPLDEATGALDPDLKAAWDDRKQAAREPLRRRLVKIVEESKGELINVALVAGYRSQRPESLASGFGDSAIALDEQVKLKDEDGIEMYEGRYSGGGLDRVRTRQYTRPIDPAPGPGADDAIIVWIKADRIDAVTANLGTRIGLISAIGGVAGIILAVIISMVLTGPIRSLERDMTIVASGDLEHQAITRSRDEIGALAHSFNQMTRSLKMAQDAALQREAMERELQIATEIQTKLLPDRIPQIPGVDIHSFYLSAREVGGDYYDFIVIDQQHLGIIVADVSGKGIPGSMVMTMFRSLVRLASVRNTSPADIFKKVNRILAKDIRRGMFVTAVFMIFDVQSKTLKIASAGHNPSVLYKAETDTIDLINPQGIALGFDKGPVFDSHIREQEIVFGKGDRIAAYTDGVTEAMNEAGDEFGDDAFYDLVRDESNQSSKDFVDAIVKRLERHRGRAEQSDDITITTLAVS